MIAHAHTYQTDNTNQQKVVVIVGPSFSTPGYNIDQFLHEFIKNGCNGVIVLWTSGLPQKLRQKNSATVFAVFS